MLLRVRTRWLSCPIRSGLQAGRRRGGVPGPGRGVRPVADARECSAVAGNALAGCGEFLPQRSPRRCLQVGGCSAGSATRNPRHNGAENRPGVLLEHFSRPRGRSERFTLRFWVSHSLRSFLGLEQRFASRALGHTVTLVCIADSNGHGSISLC